MDGLMARPLALAGAAPALAIGVKPLDSHLTDLIGAVSRPHLAILSADPGSRVSIRSVPGAISLARS
jgi:hypothetical protein